MKPKQIRKLREACGLTQGQFAKAIGTSRVTVNRWENGYYSTTGEKDGTLKLNSGWEAAIRLFADVKGIQL